MEMAVRALEGKLTIRHAGPQIQVVTARNVDAIGTVGSLAPASFVPRFSVMAASAN